MNLTQRLESLASDWRQEIERRKQFLLPIGDDLRVCLMQLEMAMAVDLAPTASLAVSTHDDVSLVYMSSEELEDAE